MSYVSLQAASPLLRLWLASCEKLHAVSYIETYGNFIHKRGVPRGGDEDTGDDSFDSDEYVNNGEWCLNIVRCCTPSACAVR